MVNHWSKQIPVQERDHKNVQMEHPFFHLQQIEYDQLSHFSTNYLQIIDSKGCEQIFKNRTWQATRSPSSQANSAKSDQVAQWSPRTHKNLIFKKIENCVHLKL